VPPRAIYTFRAGEIARYEELCGELAALEAAGLGELGGHAETE
jgi:hypothetical protein